jgi:hypothetical protein
MAKACAKLCQCGGGKPLLAEYQFSPSSVVLNTRPSPVPAYRMDGVTGCIARSSEWVSVGRPLLLISQ